MDLNKAIQSYYEFLKKKNISSSTLSDYQNDIKLFRKFLINKEDTTSLNENDYLKFIEYQNSLKLSTSTILRRMSSLSNLFRFFKGEGWIDFTLKSIPNFSDEKVLPKIFSEEEIKVFFNTTIDEKDLFELRNYAMYKIGYCSGLRINEILDLKYQDINKKDSLIYIKGKKKRKVPISSDALESIEKYYAKLKVSRIKNKDKFLFINYQGNKISRQSLFKEFKTFLKRSNIKKNLSPISLRHSFAVHLINAGCDIHVLQIMLGHTKYSTTELYSKISAQRIIDIYDKYFK